jgi:glycosyltransferase involved in cell wall biosynthesis
LHTGHNTYINKNLIRFKLTTQQYPLISVAMACFNGEKYLAEQLNSILDQTYRNIEIIITDDGSSDNTINIIKEYQASYPSIHLYQNASNTGVTKAFEKAIMNATGELIAFCDQDDIWLPEKLMLLQEALGNRDAIYSNSQLVFANGDSMDIDFKSLLNMKSYDSGVPFLLGNCVPGHTILVKKNFINSICPFSAQIMFDRWVGFCAAATNGIEYLDIVLVKYRQHENNTIGTSKSKNKNKKETTDMQFQNKLKELQLYNTAPITDIQTKLLVKQMISHFHKRWSFKRSAFFFKNAALLLAMKKKTPFRKFLYCVKMFFKPSY